MHTNSYDYIVVGGGSGGNVVATRLVEAGYQVLVLESGKTDNIMMVRAPAGLFKVIESERALTHKTPLQPSAGNRPLYIPTGHMLGGGSSINGMIYIRGQREDYDEWAAMGNPGWSWSDVLPYFKKAENNQRFANETHGNGGPLPVSDPVYKHPLSKAFVLAAQQAGYVYNDDFNRNADDRRNTHEQEGIGFYQTTTLNGQRASTVVAYLSRVRNHRNLTVKLQSPVSRILFDGPKAVGVVASLNGGADTEFRARRGVVLSAGALVSPKILMLSGVGPGEHLSKMGIRVHRDLPGVGKNLHDHLEVRVVAQTREPLSMTGQDKGLRAVRHGLEWILFKHGLLTSNIVEAGGFFDTDGDGRPDMQIHVAPVILGDEERPAEPGHGISLKPGFLRPKSRGELLLRSPKASDHAVVDPHFLEAQEDVVTLMEGVKISRKILAQPALASLTERELRPGKEDLESYVRNYAKTVFHPVGTCKMGSDDMSVVDNKLKVKGLDNLWVADASIMPAVVSGNTNAPTIMIGERAADFILQHNVH